MGVFATLGITTPSIMTLSIKNRYAECCYAECRDNLYVMLNVVMLRVMAPIQNLLLKAEYFSIPNSKVTKLFMQM